MTTGRGPTRPAAARRARGTAARPGPQWVQPMPVRDWMKRDPIVVHTETPIAVATHLMRTKKVRHLPVVDAEGRLVGIVTDRDLRQVIFEPMIQEALGDATLTLRALTVREIMTWGVVSVRADADMRAAARLMREGKFGGLPVVEDGIPIGMLSERDVLAAFESIAASRIATVRPLRPVHEPAPYDYGFTVPEAPETGRNEGAID